MNIVKNSNFRLIRADFKVLKGDLFDDNSINEWNKIIIVYNLYLFFNNLFILYSLINIISNDKSTKFEDQFKNVYLLFFIMCSIKNSYAYFILNVSKINPDLAYSFFKNSHKYFI